MFRKALIVPVHTRMYQSCTSTYSHRSHSHFISIQAPSRLLPSQVSFLAGEEELGACSPTVFQGNIMAILLNGVRVWRNDQYSILHKSSINSFKNRVCTSTYSVHISMTEYVLACTEYIHHMNASSNLGVEGMESPLWQVEGITSGTHSTPEQL